MILFDSASEKPVAGELVNGRSCLKNGAWFQGAKTKLVLRWELFQVIHNNHIHYLLSGLKSQPHVL
jgi:hypothetical protein